MPLARLLVTSLIAIAASCGSAAPLVETANSISANANASVTDGAAIAASQESQPAAIPLARLPAEMQSWAREKRQECAESGERVTAESFRPQVLDLNGDSRPDYVIAASDTFECQNGFSLWTAGQAPIHDILLSTPRGYRWQDDSIDAMGLEVASHRGKPVLRVGTEGPGAWERPYAAYAYGWNGRALDRLAFFDGEGAEVNEDGTRLGGGGWARAEFPEGLAQGFYSDDCLAASRGNSDFLRLTAQEWRDWDGSILRFTRIQRNGPVRFRFHTFLSDEAGNRTPHAIDIITRRFGEFEQVVEGEEGRFFSHCQDNEVPAQVRRDMGGR